MFKKSKKTEWQPHVSVFHGGWSRRLSHTHSYPGCHKPDCLVVALTDHGCSQYTSIAAHIFMIRFLSNDSWSFLDRFLWCHLKCIVRVLSLFFGKHRCSTWRGYRLYGPRMGPIDNFSLVTGSRSLHPTIAAQQIVGLHASSILVAEMHVFLSEVDLSRLASRSRVLKSASRLTTI